MPFADQGVLSLQEVAQAHSKAVCLQTFSDEPYNRTSFTLAARMPGQLADAAASLARAALDILNLSEHDASHPRVGVVDHISCHPFGNSTPVAEADATAHLIGQQLGDDPGVPVFLYGTAHSQARPLSRLRRDLGYFAAAQTGQWSGWGSSISGNLKIAPDFGPSTPKPSQGVCCVGSGLWVTNFNMLLLTSEMRRAQHISSLISERGGGLPGVQAMALPHQDGIEVACNLITSGDARPKPEEVQARVTQLATEQSIPVGSGYRIGKSLETLIEEATQQLSEEG